MVSESNDHRQLNIFFLPFIEPGHMIPMMDIASLFAARSGVKVTIITTTHNAPLFKSSIDRNINNSCCQIQLHILEFPSAEVGLPEGIENFKLAISSDISSKLHQALCVLQQPIKQFLRDNHPDCIISDYFYPWTADFALELGCPRIVFNGTSFFSHCVMDSIWRHKPHDKVSTDRETFVVPELPDKIEMTRLMLADFFRIKNPLIEAVRDSEPRSYGNILNSFYELEPSYADHFKNFVGRNAWQIGPVSVKREEKEQSRHECLNWLDSMKPNSVVYICFGSLVRFSKAQLVEIASALEASGHPFIWVVRVPESTSKEENEERWLPEELEENLNKLGMIIKGWAPQLAILEHQAIGGFVTHCGWNSVLESVGAGVPMITWPLFAGQFENEKLITQVLKIGVRVGAEECNSLTEVIKELINRESITKGVTQLMDDGDEANQMRKRAKDLQEKAKKAIEEGGSSYASLSDLIEELRKLRCIKQQQK